ncbi:hypothetical protein PRZ48_004623 [Zasmidium cellare]|uniref:Uncharacterized protein n=1 Tax=Zasmidium cellare TaxID=395010 RepID=A0ABR0ES82_ZASCE|nr:hypothetical protein PRZ48_004623 [Zasmidium cellare]
MPVFFGPERAPVRFITKSKRLPAIEEELERIHELTHEVVNTKNFHPHAELWQHFAESISVSVEMPHVVDHVTHYTVKQFREHQKNCARQFPDIQLNSARLAEIQAELEHIFDVINSAINEGDSGPQNELSKRWAPVVDWKIDLPHKEAEPKRSTAVECVNSQKRYINQYPAIRVESLW